MPDVKVVQHGTSHAHTARCETCGWQTSAGSMRAAQTAAQEHRQTGCPGSAPGTAMVPAAASPPSNPATPWSGEQLTILKRDLGIKNDGDLAYFAQVAGHKGLDPFLGEIVPVYYGGQMQIQETVEGLRTIAERSGLYDGFDGPYWCGPDLVWKPVWLDDGPPAAARYFVRRKDWAEPASGVARWRSSVQLDRNGKPQPIWRDRPDEMLGKTAEVRALKRAFPKEFARAGVPVRDLSDAQVVTIEARRAGLDDQARHQLAAQVSDGRTESTRELTDDELLKMRGEVAKRAEPEPDAVERTIARGSGNLETRMDMLNEQQHETIRQFRRAHGLTKPLKSLDPAARALISTELDQRGWASPYDFEPEADTEPSDAEVVPDGPPDPDLFSDEPF